MAITPRYFPPPRMAMRPPSRRSDKAAYRLEHASRRRSPIRRTAPINPSLSLDIDARLSARALYEPVSRGARRGAAGNRYHLTLSDGVVPAARDFELVYTPDVGAEPGAAFFTQSWTAARTAADGAAARPTATRPLAPRARSPTSSTRRARWKACRSRRRAKRC
jgi:hypothetical protein